MKVARLLKLADASFQAMLRERILVAPPLQGLPVSAPRPKPLLEATILPGDALYVPFGD
ncbi:hypothetical protein AK812_SmicGene45469, partial [Symbiodinium microadriaticum]